MPSPWVRRALAGELPPKSLDRYAPEVKALPEDRICWHVQCRDPRQDLQCYKPLGHDGSHYHSIVLGYCDPRWQHLTPNGGGHRQPRVTREQKGA